MHRFGHWFDLCGGAAAAFVGSLSPWPAQRVCERLAGHGAGVRLRRLPGHGHKGALEDPAAVAAQWPWCMPVREAA